jgi:hypothetical protein
MEKSESIKELSAAMAKFTLALDGAAKDKTNPHFKSKYADLSSVCDAIRTALAGTGLSYVQNSHQFERGAAIETVILHSSGEWLSTGIVPVSMSKGDAQGFGSAMTYARRYSLSMAFGVAPDDDDGNAAVAKKTPDKTPDSRPINPNDVGKATWENANNEQKSFLVDCLTAVTDALAESPEAAADALYSALKLDMDEIGAVWSQLDSKQRAAIKAFKPQPEEK